MVSFKFEPMQMDMSCCQSLSRSPGRTWTFCDSCCCCGWCIIYTVLRMFCRSAQFRGFVHWLTVCYCTMWIWHIKLART